MGKAKTDKLDLGILADRYGQLSAEIEERTKEKEDISKLIKGRVAVGEACNGTTFVVFVRERIKKALSPAKVYKLIPKLFFAVVKVINKEAEKYLTAEQMDQATETAKPEVYLKVEKL